eukprot:130091-Amphidinium_carterae.1
MSKPQTPLKTVEKHCQSGSSETLPFRRYHARCFMESKDLCLQAPQAYSRHKATRHIFVEFQHFASSLKAAITEDIAIR